MQIPGPLSSLAESHSLSVGSRCVLWAAWMILIHTHAGNCCSNSASMLSPDFKHWVWQYLPSWEQSRSPPSMVGSTTPSLVFTALCELPIACSSLFPHPCFPWALGFNPILQSWGAQHCILSFTPPGSDKLVLIIGGPVQGSLLLWIHLTHSSVHCSSKSWDSDRLRFWHLLAMWPQESPQFLWVSVLSCKEWG